MNNILMFIKFYSREKSSMNDSSRGPTAQYYLYTEQRKIKQRNRLKVHCFIAQPRRRNAFRGKKRFLIK